MHLAELSDVHKSIEPIGHSCPNRFGDGDYRGEDFEALAIAKSMPGLRHLGVVENGMTNEGRKPFLTGARILSPSIFGNVRTWTCCLERSVIELLGK
ncbi:unnamed protein product [Cuscuta campestris]|uniref:Uncharacterized protein n=1 Tax=Cuscuta campestris TaxID=132261 RepID=A0A484K7W1_9ASTE|nr:unnamed protein product [Cuscuta campestris]